MEPMVYIHIPFCKRKCQYCDFLSFPPNDRRTMSSYVEALKREILSYKKEDTLIEVSSVFIGGGTPSLLPVEEFVSLMDCFHQVFHLKEGGEFTIESNPGTITEEKASAWKECGVNRVSMGVQSLDDQLLKTLGRIHTSEKVRESYRILRETGFDNINFDLMSGLPSQTMETWMDTLKEAVEMGPEHLSCYSLILEEGTPFYEHQNDYVFPDEETDRDMYHRMKEFLKEQGYERYEISNFSKTGKESRHNTGYWRRVPYYGLGLGASGLTENGIRTRNTDQMEDYLMYSHDPEKRFVEQELLSKKDQMEEFMFLGLRCQKGVTEQAFLAAFGSDMDTIYGEVLRKHERDGLLIREGTGWYLSDKGVDLSNQVFVDFLLDE